MSSSNEIILLNDPLGDSIESVCFNTTQWIATQESFKQTAMQFGYFCLAAGLVLGLIIGYFYCKRTYGSSE